MKHRFYQTVSFCDNSEALTRFVVKDGKIIDIYQDKNEKTIRKEYPDSIKITSNLMYFLGYCIMNGRVSLDRNCFKIELNHKNQEKKIENALKELGIEWERHKPSGATRHIYYINGGFLTFLFEYFYNKGELQEEMLGAGKRLQDSFVSGIFEAFNYDTKKRIVVKEEFENAISFILANVKKPATVSWRGKRGAQNLVGLKIERKTKNKTFKELPDEE